MSRRKLPRPSKVLKPHPAVDISPPDVAPEDSAFQNAAPTLDEAVELCGKDSAGLSNVTDVVDIDEVEKRITLLARMILEKTLWSPEGLTKKERADIALNTIRVLEGSKIALWRRDEDDDSIPKSQEEIQKETKATEARLISLLKKEKTLKNREKEFADAAIAVAAAHNGVTDE